MTTDVPEHEDETRAAYDVVAGDYEDLLRGALADSPWDRAVLAGFAAQVLGSGGGAVADLGCGPGRVTGHLHDLGLDVARIDLSPGMVAVAQATHPHLSFAVGSMRSLELADGALAGAVAWYSVIHTPPGDRPALYAELARVLRPGGHLAVAFQVGDECVHVDHADGHDLSLDAVVGQRAEAGLAEVTRLVREPTPPERPRQADLATRRR